MYHIYPFGFFDALQHAGKKEPVSRILKLREFYEYFGELGINIIQFGPVFQSESHGYDTQDYLNLDTRLGTNDDFKQIVDELHSRGIRVILDGVFNHTGRSFFSFRDVIENQKDSEYIDWHFIDFSGDSGYNDGFSYKDWEGHQQLAKLNVNHPEVRVYLQEVVKFWVGEIGIDGWRLDVAYLLDHEFWKELKSMCQKIKPDFFLVGELIRGPYTRWVSSLALHSGTSYEVHKSIRSAIKSKNMHELHAHLNYAFHPQHGIHKDLFLMNFLGNHDVDRIASVLNEKDLIPAFLLLYTLPGYPKVYYGDEVAFTGKKEKYSDDNLRIPMTHPGQVGLSIGHTLRKKIKELNTIRQNTPALRYGVTYPVFANSTIIAFLRKTKEQEVVVIVNFGKNNFSGELPLHKIPLQYRKFRDLLDGNKPSITVRDNQLCLPEVTSKWGCILASEY